MAGMAMAGPLHRRGGAFRPSQLFGVREAAVKLHPVSVARPRLLLQKPTAVCLVARCGQLAHMRPAVELVVRLSGALQRQDLALDEEQGPLVAGQRLRRQAQVVEPARDVVPGLRHRAEILPLRLAGQHRAHVV